MTPLQTADAGGSPHSQLRALDRRVLHPLGRRVRRTLQQTARSSSARKRSAPGSYSCSMKSGSSSPPTFRPSAHSGSSTGTHCTARSRSTGFRLPRYEKKLPVILSKAEVKALLEAPKNLNHRAMLATMYGAGLRVSEVAEPEGFRSGSRTPRHLGSRRQRPQGQASDAGRAAARGACRVLALEAAHRLALPRREGRIAPSQRNSVFQACRKAARQAGITKPVHPHSLRHAFRHPSAGRRGEPARDSDLCWATHISEPRPAICTSPTAPFVPPKSPLEMLGSLDLVRASDSERNDERASARSGRCLPHLRKRVLRAMGTRARSLISEKLSKRSATAARLRSAAMWSMWSSAIRADIGSSPITRAATGIARKCQAMARAKWLAEREAELLPVPYFHVVFTLPRQDRQAGAAERARDLSTSCSAPRRKRC